jgi:hypothetical protein
MRIFIFTMGTMQNSAACSICNKHDHSSNHCPDLRDPLKEGFYTGGGAGGGGGGDDEDERIRFTIMLWSQPTPAVH